MSEQERKSNRMSYIDYAITSWGENKKGNFRKWEERHAPEYCQEQIDYFTKMKQENS